jgi:alkylation response protein AidB-like acyl-CoA dehydrogenase
MDYSFTEQQQMLKKAARDFLSARCDKPFIDRVTKTESGFDTGMWREMADLGWQGLIVPEAYGGTGGDFLDLCALLEETGGALLPAPLFATVVGGAIPLMLAGSKAQQERFLPRIASGEAIFSLALLESEATYEAADVKLEAKPAKDGYLLNGKKLFVPYGGSADYLICAARTGAGLSLFIVDAHAKGVSHTPLVAMGGEKKYEVTFADVTVSGDRLLGEKDKGWPIMEQILDRATVAKCAEMLGGMQHVLDFTIGYVKQRVQFGRPIGSFQAVQHHCANIVMGIELARGITWEAAWRVSMAQPAALEAAMAKQLANEAYLKATVVAHQVHGGIGLIREHPLHLYYREARTAAYAYGDTPRSTDRVAAAVAAGAPVW